MSLRTSIASLTLGLTALALLLLPAASPAHAQSTGSITGVIVDAETGEELIGANVVIADTTDGFRGTATDLNGRFSLKGLAPDTYDLRVTYVSYQAKTVTGVAVQAGKATEIDISLQPETEELGEVTVTAETAKDSEAGLLRQRQDASSVSNAISAEAISRAGAGNVADALKKVTGATIVGGKYANVRGLQGRYVNTQLNGSDLPSVDPDGQSVALDIFPSSIIDNVVTTKSFTPDKPGDFTGGALDISTKSFPSEFFVNLSLSSSINSEVGVGGTVLQPVGGLSEIPDAAQNPDLPEAVSLVFNNDDRAALLNEATRAFGAPMSPAGREIVSNYSGELALGNEFEVLGGRPLGVIAAFSYDQSYTGFDDGQTARYESVGQSADRLIASSVFPTVQQGTEEQLYGGLAGVSLQLSPRNEISLRGLYNVDREESARVVRAGRLPRDLTGGQLVQSRTQRTIERTIASLELKGDHELGGNPSEGRRGIRLEWKSAASQATRDEPDFRVFTNDFDVTDRDTSFSITSAIYSPAVSRYFRNLQEQNWTNTLSVRIPVGTASIEVGGRYKRKTREFREQRFDYQSDQARYAGDPDDYVTQRAGWLNPDAPPGERNRFGTYVVEIPQSNNNYDARQDVGAGYAMAEIPIPGLPAVEFIGGLRVEYTDMEVNTFGGTSGNFQETTLLPSGNLIWGLRDNMNLRLAYGRTLARPTFREFAPFGAYEFVGDFLVSGNPELEQTVANNVDLRWEWFLQGSELLSASVYYKALRQPIERIIDVDAGGTEVAVTYENKDFARVYGLEVEATKRLGFLADWLRYVQVGGNLTLTQSAIQRSDEEIDAIEAYDEDPSTTRQLQGQSPYIVNLNLGYENPETGTSINVFYNRFGDRLETVTRSGIDIFERGRNTVDVLAAQEVLNGVNLKASVKNVLNEPEVLAQDFLGVEYVNDRIPLGRSISVGVSYSF
jgi:TonB-dependent receptor